ncbi:MAG: small multi-drug export protein [Candidatus Thermoplasmatota archaeon]|nr:small multi-drug export protein [Candidatus Thermoplasmatota archaeon]
MNIKFKRDIIVSFIKFISPVIIGFSVLTTVGLFIVENFQIKYWSLISGYFFPPLGKETIIPAGIIAGINPLIMALSIAFVDIIVALFLVWNYDLAKKIPLIGSFIDKIEKIGKKTSSKYNWIKPLRFIGIMLFVMVPFQGSGGLVGSIIGRLIGVKPWNIFFAISAGSIFGCILIAYFSDIILSILIRNFLLGLLLIIIVITIVIMYFAYNKLIKK